MSRGHRGRIAISESLLPNSSPGDFGAVESTLEVPRNQEMALCAGKEHFIFHYCVCVSAGTHSEM